jgi:hypothetical protein
MKRKEAPASVDSGFDARSVKSRTEESPFKEASVVSSSRGRTRSRGVAGSSSSRHSPHLDLPFAPSPLPLSTGAATPSSFVTLPKSVAEADLQLVRAEAKASFDRAIAKVNLTQDEAIVETRRAFARIVDETNQALDKAIQRSRRAQEEMTNAFVHVLA